jgi:carbonic anhydrase
MELHVVFFNSKYKTMQEATNHHDGLAVMAFFFRVSKANPAYEEMSELLATITKPQTIATFSKPVALKDLMLVDMSEYYVYNGSLTTPPCLEVVTWLDFYDPIEISHDQVRRWRKFFDLYRKLAEKKRCSQFLRIVTKAERGTQE